MASPFTRSFVMEDGYYSMDALAERYGVARPTIKRWVRDRGFPPGVLPGEVKPVKAKSRYGENYTRSRNCRVLYPKSEVHKWEKSLPREPVIPREDDED